MSASRNALAALAALSLGLMACSGQRGTGPGGAPAREVTFPTVARSNPLLSPVASPVASPGLPGGAANLGLPLGNRVSGTVQSVDGRTVTLADGTRFEVGERASVIRTQTGGIADLQPGQYAAITARAQEDGTLLASIVSVFPENLRGGAGQRPMSDGNLMTNAIIEEAQIETAASGELTVSFPGQTARVRIPPGAQIQIRSTATLADLQPGRTVSANLSNGVASSLNVQ
jgi:hypothetical protein